MDKLRSLHYFVAAAEASSFSAAARRFGVSTAAVAKLIQSLERELGLTLFERHAHGLALTAGGTAYLEACRPALDQLARRRRTGECRDLAGQRHCGGGRAADHRAGVPDAGAAALQRAVPGHPAGHPLLHAPTEEQTRGVDVMLVLGWPQRRAIWCAGRSAPPASSCARRRRTGPCTACRSTRANWSGTTACASVPPWAR